MTSTDKTTAPSRRLAPLPGLLENMLDQAIRARQRRVFTAAHPGQNLAALTTQDAAIDRILQAVMIYGTEALSALEKRLETATNSERDAIIFLQVAVSIQTRDAGLLTIVSQHQDKHWDAIHQALWFSPVPGNVLADDTTHLRELFAKAKTNASLMPLALQLAGERDIKTLRSEIKELLQQPDIAAWAHFALVCMGSADKTTEAFVQDLLQSENPEQVIQGLQIACVFPGIPTDTALQHSLSAPQSFAEIAWGILACRHPRQVFDYAMANEEIPVAIKIRLVAFTGYIDGAIAVCAELAEREGSVTPAEADVLTLIFGEVPTAARCEPNDREAKSKALRELVMRACRTAHIAIQNNADRCSWQTEEILTDPNKAITVRLREGKRFPESVPPLGGILFEVTHGLRQWLYIERAYLGKHALPLFVQDISRRQALAIMIAEVADGMQDH